MNDNPITAQPGFMSDLYQQSAFLAALINLFLAVFVLVKNPRRKLNQTFAFVSFVLFLWNMGAFFQAPELIYISLIFVPAASLHFILTFIHQHSEFSSIVLKFCYSASTLLGLSYLGGVLQGRLFHYFLALYIAPVIVYIIQRIYQRRRITKFRLEKKQLSHILIATIVAVLAAITDFAASIGFPAPKLANVGILLYVIVIAVAIVRHRLLDMEVLFGRGIILLIFTFIIWSFSGVFGGWWVETPYHNIGGILVATIFILIIYEPLKVLIERQADKVLQKQSYEFQNMLSRLSWEIISIINRDDLIKSVSHSLSSSEKVGDFSIYVQEGEDENFVLYDQKSNVDLSRKNAVIEKATPLVQYLLQKKNVVDKDEIERELQLWLLPEQKKMLKSVHRTMTRIRSDMCIPLIYHANLLGFMNLSTDEADVRFTSREKDLLTAVANQLAISLENARIYEQMKKSDRLIALGEMAAGLAHEIRNPLGAIKATAQFLQSPTGNQDISEFLDIIIEEVNRLNDVVTKFLDFSRPAGRNIEKTDINELIEKTVQLMKQSRKMENISLETDLDPELPLIEANPNELKQVFINMMNNSCEAMAYKGELSVKTEAADFMTVTKPENLKNGKENVSQLPDSSKFIYIPRKIRIRITDSGEGINPEMLDRLFNPFFTTKRFGTGLGLAIVHKIIEGHGGTVSVKSKKEKSTQFTIELPIHQDHSGETKPAGESKETESIPASDSKSQKVSRPSN